MSHHHHNGTTPKTRNFDDNDDSNNDSSNIGGAGGGGEDFTSTFIIIILVIVVIIIIVYMCFSIKIVKEYQRAVIFRLGRIVSGAARGPGMICTIPCTDTYRLIDMRTVSFDVPPQEILTHDSVTISVDAVVYYKVFNPIIAIANVSDYSSSTKLLASAVLRNVLGTKNLAQILSERTEISGAMQSALDEATDPWGVKVERVEIKDVRLPIQMQRAMAAEAEASREAKAKVIAAEGEVHASEKLREASQAMASSPGALQLRYLQTLSNIAAERNSTIIFPLPLDIVAPFIKK